MILFGTKMFGAFNVVFIAIVTLISIISQMILAWALDQVIDLNNGLDVSHHLKFNEEILCLTTIFSYSIVCVISGMFVKFLCENDDPK